MTAQALSPHSNRFFPRRFMAWQHRGLSVRAAGVVALAGCDTVEEISRLGRDYFAAQPNCATKTMAELALLAGWPPRVDTAVDAIAAALSLAINDPEETREVATDVMIALRRSGFVISARRMGPQ